MLSIRFRAQRGSIIAAIACALIACAAQAQAATGNVDITFGNAGVWNPPPECCGGTGIAAIALQADGKVVVAGDSSNGYATQVSVSRLNADGTLDGSFAAGGTFALALSDQRTAAAAACVLADGSILVGGSATDEWGIDQPFVFKLTSAGGLDTAFGASGVARMHADDGLGVSAMQVQGDGKIVLAGTEGSGASAQMFAARLLADGEVDPGFGAGGIQTSGYPQSQGSALAIDTDGSMMIAGSAHVAGASSAYPALIRLDASGAFDASLNGTGKLIPAMNFPGAFASLAVQPDGRILLDGVVNNKGSVVRFTHAGALDPGYNASGVQPLNGAADQLPRAIFVRPDGSQLVFVLNALSVMIYHVFADGTLDSAYTRSVTGVRPGANIAFAVTAAGDMWIGTGGFAVGHPDATVYKLDASGNVVATFGQGGQAALFSGLTLPVFGGFAVDGEGRIYTIHNSTCESRAMPPACATLVRLTPAGVPDPAFGTGGSVSLTSSTPGIAGFSTAIARRGDGKLYVADVESSPTAGMTLHRLNADGTVDTSFSPPRQAGAIRLMLPYPGTDTRTMLVTDFIGRYLDDGTFDPTFNLGAPLAAFGVSDVALSPDGFVMVGASPIPFHGCCQDTLLWKRLADGSADLSFGSGGTVTFSGVPYYTQQPGGVSFSFHKVAVQPNGAIVVAGAAQKVGDFSQYVALLRFTPSGQPDATFGTNGVAFVPIPAGLSAFVNTLHLQDDGKIAVVGQDWAARVDADGGLDLHFGAGGRITFAFSSDPLVPSRSGDTIGAASFLPDGSIVMVGSTNGFDSTTSRAAVMKLLGQPFALQVSPAALSAGGPNVPYAFALSASGGVPPYTFSVANGALPPGLSLIGGTIAGTPGATGAYPFVIQVRDANGAMGAASFTLTIEDQLLLVNGYYQDILGRAADEAGALFWSREIDRMARDGVAVSEAFYALAGVFFTGPEYVAKNKTDTEFITDLYHTFFSRDPDAAGLDFWVSQLASGRQRSAVMNEFLFSPEFTGYMTGVFGSAAAGRAEVSMVLDFYRGLLGRLPDDAGVAFWVQQMRTAQCTSAQAVQATAASISEQFLASPEYANRDLARPAGERNEGYVLDLYSAFMRRGADVAGLEFYDGQLGAGAMNRDQVRAIFVNSAEFQGRVNAVIAQGCLH